MTSESTPRETPPRQSLTLAQYVQRRNGVPLGASGSLRNMLARSLGAGSPAEFWRYWNPIWGYALGRYVYAPFRRYLPPPLALIVTFAVSGALHDAVIMLIRGEFALLFTPWFVLMALGVIAGQALNVDYGGRAWTVRAAINLAYVLACLAIVLLAGRVV